MSTSVSYHAGCSECASAKIRIVQLSEANQPEANYLEQGQGNIAGAEANGVKSATALVLSNGNVHIGFKYH